jgi:hypothetical protein
MLNSRSAVNINNNNNTSLPSAPNHISSMKKVKAINVNVAQHPQNVSQSSKNLKSLLKPK